MDAIYGGYGNLLNDIVYAYHTQDQIILKRAGLMLQEPLPMDTVLFSLMPMLGRMIQTWSSTS